MTIVPPRKNAKAISGIAAAAISPLPGGIGTEVTHGYGGWVMFARTTSEIPLEPVPIISGVNVAFGHKPSVTALAGMVPYSCATVLGAPFRGLSAVIP